MDRGTSKMEVVLGIRSIADVPEISLQDNGQNSSPHRFQDCWVFPASTVRHLHKTGLFQSPPVN